jgi:hypothetical protein
MIIDKLPRDIRVPEPFDLDVNPQSEQYKSVQPMCDPENPSRCLVSTLGYVQSGGWRVTFNFEHTPSGPAKGCIRVSLGKGYSAKRVAPPEVLDIASKFDQRLRIRKRAVFTVDITDGTWVYEYRESKGGAKTSENNQGRGTSNDLIKSVRAKSLRRVRKQLAAA